MWSKVLIPPIWSNNRKDNAFSGGLGVSYLEIKGIKSCNIALGLPVVPVVNKIKPGCFFSLIILRRGCSAFFWLSNLMSLFSSKRYWAFDSFKK